MALGHLRKQRVDERATRLRAGLQPGQLRDGLPSDGKPSVSIEFRNQFRGSLPVSKRGRRGQCHRRSQGLDPAHEVLPIKAYGFLMHQQVELQLPQHIAPRGPSQAGEVALHSRVGIRQRLRQQQQQRSLSKRNAPGTGIMH